MTEQTPLERLLTALLAARPPMDADDRAVAVGVYRRLALGHPATDAQVASDTGQPVDRVHERLEFWPGVYRNDQQEVIGFWGLTTVEMPPHRYSVGGVPLWTWCAFDTLFITPVLGDTAQVASIDAETGEPVALAVTAAGVTGTSHPQLVMSFLNPTGRFDADVIQSFCHFVHFFASPNSGERWIARHPGTFLMHLDDALTLGTGYANALLAGAD